MFRDTLQHNLKKFGKINKVCRPKCMILELRKKGNFRLLIKENLLKVILVMNHKIS